MVELLTLGFCSGHFLRVVRLSPCQAPSSAGNLLEIFSLCPPPSPAFSQQNKTNHLFIHTLIFWWQVSHLSWLEKKTATALFESSLSATVQDALQSFLKVLGRTGGSSGRPQSYACLFCGESSLDQDWKALFNKLQPDLILVITFLKRLLPFSRLKNYSQDFPKQGGYIFPR